MAVISGTLKTYEVVGQREDLSDTIYNISPEDTPILSQMGRGSISNTHFEWQVDELEAADSANAHLEGDDAAFTDVTPTERIGNYAQISKKTLIVSGTAEATDKAGRKSERAYQMAKKFAGLKIDMETIAVSNQAAVAGAAGVARKTGGLLAFLKTNVSMAGDGSNPTGTSLPNDARGDGTQRAFTEAMLKSVISSCWTNGAKPKYVFVGAFNKQVASGFDGIATPTINHNSSSPATIVAAADVYVSDFGKLSIVPARNMRTRDALVLDFEFLRVDFLRKFKREKLAKTGDAEKEQLLVEWGLRVGNEASQGLIADLTTS